MEKVNKKLSGFFAISGRWKEIEAILAETLFFLLAEVSRPPAPAAKACHFNHMF
jgi:hypothetical protein